MKETFEIIFHKRKFHKYRKNKTRDRKYKDDNLLLAILNDCKIQLIFILIFVIYLIIMRIQGSFLFGN